MLCFGGDRTYHRMAVNIEDAGWIVRGMMAWIYGQGRPKRYDIHKAMIRDGNEADAADWNGYDAGLKPAMEPICVAMKPLDGPFSENAIKWGVAGFNVDRCRIDVDAEMDGSQLRTMNKNRRNGTSGQRWGFDRSEFISQVVSPSGRYPANVLLDEESAEILDDQSGELKSGALTPISAPKKNKSCYGSFKHTNVKSYASNTGGASRFFYVAKASPAERNAGLNGEENTHPTVKPLSLMRYLVRLTKTPSGGVVYDPYLGSGTTGMACIMEERDWIGSEMDKEYANIAAKRIEWAMEQHKNSTAQHEMFRDHEA